MPALFLSSRVPYLCDGVTPAGLRIVCPRSERRFSVSVWVRFSGQLMVGPHASVCGVSARPVLQGVLPGGPNVSVSLGCPSLPPVFFTVICWGSVLPPRPLLRVWGCLGYPALLSASWGFVPRSVARLAPCSRWRPLTGWSSLKLRVLGGSWFSPLCSPGRRSASRSTCSALPPVSRLFFGLGAFSFG